MLSKRPLLSKRSGEPPLEGSKATVSSDDVLKPTNHFAACTQKQGHKPTGGPCGLASFLASKCSPCSGWTEMWWRKSPRQSKTLGPEDFKLVLRKPPRQSKLLSSGVRVRSAPNFTSESLGLCVAIYGWTKVIFLIDNFKRQPFFQLLSNS